MAFACMAVIEHPFSDVGAQLEHLYEEHGDRVRAICLALLRDRHEAEDAAQQVFLSALRSLHNGTVPRDPGAWLATISRHECWARAGRPAAAPLHAGLHDVNAEDPSASAVRRLELAETWRTIAALPGRQRDVLLLREVRGLGYHELAEGLQLSQPSVRSLLTRARRTLRAQLERGAAVLTGGPWLKVSARLFGDGSNPALSSITRTAAVGLGAVALTGGAVVVPRLATHPHAHRAPARSSRPRVNGVAHRAPVVAAPATSRLRDSARSNDGGRTADRHRGRDGGGSGAVATSGDGGGDGGGQIVSSSGSGSGGSESSGSDGGSNTSTSGDSSGTSSSGSSGDSGSDGSGSVSTVSSSDGGGARQALTDREAPRARGAPTGWSSGSSSGSDGSGSVSDGGS